MECKCDTRLRLRKGVKNVCGWLLVALWMGLIFCISAQPELPHHPEHVLDLIVKKAGHIVEYGILTGLVWVALGRDPEGGRRRALLYVFLFSGLYAVSDEVHQFFVPGRSGQLLDVAFDLLGVAVASALVRNCVVGRRLRQLR